MQNSMEGWADFVQDMNQYYGVRMDCLSDHFHNEQRDYYLQTSAWVDTHPSQMLGPASCFKRYDLATVSLEELSAPLKVRPCPREPVSSSQHSSSLGRSLRWRRQCAHRGLATRLMLLCL